MNWKIVLNVFNDEIKKVFEILENFSNDFANGFEYEKNFFKNDLKYFFQFMKKEISDVNKIYDEFKITKEIYVEQFNKVNKLTTKNEKENKELRKKIIKCIKNNQILLENYLKF